LAVSCLTADQRVREHPNELVLWQFYLYMLLLKTVTQSNPPETCQNCSFQSSASARWTVRL
jgi:hypothetical protein